MSTKQIANGQAIRAIRRAKNIGLRDFARRIDRDPGFLVHIEAGRRQPSAETLTDIRQELDVPIEAITRNAK